MSDSSDKTVAELEQELAEVRTKLRAAKKAEKEEAARLLKEAKSDLGVWLADEVGAAKIEDVERLRNVLDLDAIRDAFKAAPEVPEKSETVTEEVATDDQADGTGTGTDVDPDEDTEPMSPAERDEASYVAGIGSTGGTSWP